MNVNNFVSSHAPLKCTGRFLLVSKTGRVEKTVDGHKGAVLGIRWAVPDGSALLTCNEGEGRRECYILLFTLLDSWRGWCSEDMVKDWYAKDCINPK